MAHPPFHRIIESKFAKDVVRTLSNPDFEPRTSQSRAPHHLLDGVVTPNGVFFTIVHDGVPAIDPAQHQLLIHGLVKQPLVFTLDALHRYPMTSRTTFIECGGNSAALFSPQPLQADVQALHGLASCAEWTGVKLSTLLEETGIDPRAKWFVGEGADTPHLSRSAPLAKGLDDAMVVMYQNGEPLMPGNGYPLRLLLPGFEGNMNVKYLRRIKLLNEPQMSFYESKTYTTPLPNGKAYQFYFINEVKSFITRPSPGSDLQQPGFFRLTLAKELAFALQFTRMNVEQLTTLSKYEIPDHIEALDARLDNRLTDELPILTMAKLIGRLSLAWKTMGTQNSLQQAGAQPVQRAAPQGRRFH
jgi:sulfane dehydrogenase subunit SoxC